MDLLFDSRFDRTPISQSGAVDLIECYLNHAVPADLADDSVQYNHIDEPSSIDNRPRDVFDSIAQIDSYRRYASSRAENK